MSITLTESRRKRLCKFLTDQYDDAVKGQQAREQLVQELNRRREAKSTPKNFPFRGASSVHVPLVTILGDSIVSRMLNGLRAQPDAFLSATPYNEEPIPGLRDPLTNKPMTWRRVAEDLEEYLLFEIGASGEVNLIQATEQHVDSKVFLGTAFIMGIWDQSFEYDYVEGGKAPIKKLFRNNARFLNLNMDDVYYPRYYDSLDRIPLFGRRYLARASELIARTGGVDGFDEAAVKKFLERHPAAKVGEVDVASSDASGAMDSSNYTAEELWICESWCRVDLDGKGHEVKLMVDHPLDSPDDILRVIPWPYAHKELSVGVDRYVRRRGMLAGKGLTEILASLDEAFSTNFNQGIDNVTIANTRMWGAPPNSDTALSLTDIWPNKVIPMSDPKDLVPIQAGEAYPSIFEMGNVIRTLAEMASKVSDYNLGRESQALGRQSTATATLALLQESGQHFDTKARATRDVINVLLPQWVDMLAQFKPMARIARVLGNDRARVLLAAISLPPGDLRRRIAVQVSFSSTAATRELARQEEANKLQVMEGYYRNLLQLADLRFGSPAQQIPAADPQKAFLIDAVAKDSRLRIEKYLEAFGERSAAALLPDWEGALNAGNPGNGTGTPTDAGIPGEGGAPSGIEGLVRPQGDVGMGNPDGTLPA